MKAVIFFALWIGVLQGANPVFSHKKHAPLKMACVTCHTGAEAKDRSGFPAATLCQTCHREFNAKLPSQRVYKLADFVLFSHTVHAKAGAQCTTCHGDVWQQEALAVFRSLKMASCVECHKEKHATEACTACHELGQ